MDDPFSAFLSRLLQESFPVDLSTFFPHLSYSLTYRTVFSFVDLQQSMIILCILLLLIN